MSGIRISAPFGLAAAAVAAAFIVAPAATQPKSEQAAALARLEPGLWLLRDLEDVGAAPQAICLADAAALTQVEHRAAACSRTLVDNGSKAATVHYTCPLNGFGRTTVRVETSKLAQIETQGIKGNVPFSHRLEARRTGACQGPGGGGRR